MVLHPGDKILAVHRRLFEGDSPRFFVGEVEECEGGLARVHGESWTRDMDSGLMVHKSMKRTKILALASGTLIVYQLPADTRLADAELRANSDGGLELVDHHELSMDLSDQLHIAAIPTEFGQGFPKPWWDGGREAG